MKIEDVIQQLQCTLPIYTDALTDNFDVSAAIRTGTTITIATTQPHGLSTGNYALITGARNPISISGLGQTGGIATATTSEDHDLTFNQQEFNYQQYTYIEIAGANEAQYNGIHRLRGVENRREFSFEVDSGSPSPATGTIYLLQTGRGYNGWYQVTVIDPNTFTYESTEFAPNSPAQGAIKAKLRPRISGGVNADEVIRAYTKQIDAGAIRVLWAFVVMGDKIANKDRTVNTDATSSFDRGAEYRQEFIQPFSIYAIFPATNSIVARKERDDADELVLPLCKSLLRLKLPTGFSEAEGHSGATFLSDRFSLYNNGIYVHEYTFETTGYITYNDTLAPEDSFAFRDISLNFKSIFNPDQIAMTANIDLDEDQLT